VVVPDVDGVSTSRRAGSGIPDIIFGSCRGLVGGSRGFSVTCGACISAVTMVFDAFPTVTELRLYVHVISTPLTWFPVD